MSEHQIDPKYGVPILGTAKATSGPNAPGLTANCDVYDSEINEIHKIIDVLNQRSQGSVEYDAFQREIHDRFNSIGFTVSVAWWSTNVEGVLMPEITIKDRTERGHAFDHDQKVHEITNDVLGLGESGVIATEPGQFEKPNHAGHGH